MTNEPMTATTITVQPGQIFYNSWGYDQTNIDFYEVVRVTSSGKSAEVRPIGAHVQDYGGPNGNRLVPDRTIHRRYDVITGAGTARKRPTKVCKIRTGWKGAPTLVLESGQHWAERWDGSPLNETDPVYGH